MLLVGYVIRGLAVTGAIVVNLLFLSERPRSRPTFFATDTFAPAATSALGPATDEASPAFCPIRQLLVSECFQLAVDF